MNTNKTILVVAAHSDDEILGCGGTVARLINEGYKAYTLILGEGKTSRITTNTPHEVSTEQDLLHKEAINANKIIGIDEVFFEDLPDNRFDSINILDVVKIIESYKNKIKPSIIFTHYENDLNIDHKVTFNAVLTATRPMLGEPVNKIYSYEVLSSTEWRFPQSFHPDTFVDISKTIDKKVEAMEIYQSELRDFPHPRSLKGIRIQAENWGIRTGLSYAEAFMTIRNII
jgi:LmbE family N-acetylglucosaminyl deacetylase